MRKPWDLKQTKQCATCPWRQDSSVDDIPEYDAIQHRLLAETIADPNGVFEQSDIDRPLRIMACHYSTTGEDMRHCIGWLNHQLGVGNNIPLRIAMATCENADEIELDGEQKSSFEETFCSQQK